MDNVMCNWAKRAIHLNGLPEMPIKSITITNSILSAEQGAMLNYVDGLTLENVKINNKTGETLDKRNGVTNLTMK